MNSPTSPSVSFTLRVANGSWAEPDEVQAGHRRRPSTACVVENPMVGTAKTRRTRETWKASDVLVP